MMMPNEMRASVPPSPQNNRKGKSPTLLTDDKVKVLLSSPNTWYIIGTKDKWISGVKANIESMTQKNISQLKDKGKFEIVQRKNDLGTVDIYCQWIPNEETI